jgi:small subunit ribosomal protein S5
VIAGGPVRAIMEAAGVQDVLSKSIGSSNPHNVVKATMAALLQLMEAAAIARRRGMTTQELFSRGLAEG